MTRRIFAYTNHTLLPEALETWPVAFFERLLPRHLQIIYLINRALLEEIAARYPHDTERRQRMSLIDESYGRHVRMAHVAVVGSHKVNGVRNCTPSSCGRRSFATLPSSIPTASRT